MIRDSVLCTVGPLPRSHMVLAPIIFGSILAVCGLAFVAALRRLQLCAYLSCGIGGPTALSQPYFIAYLTNPLWPRSFAHRT